jgi:predicted component of type VI protein secretion system
MVTVTLVEVTRARRVVGSFRQPRIWVADRAGPAADAAIAGAPHFLLSLADGALSLRSATPVHVNGVARTEGEIRSGDRLAMGDAFVEVVLDDRPPSRQLPEITVVQIAPEREAPRVFRQTSIRFGKRPDNDVFIISPLLGPLHTILYWRDDALHVCDMGSLNATFVGADRLPPNGERALKSGDTIALAGRFTFELAIEPAPP